MQAAVQATLRTALTQLETERSQVEQQIQAIRVVLDMPSSVQKSEPAPASRGRKTMSPAARKLISQRMKAKWAQRRAAAAAKVKANEQLSKKMKDLWAKRRKAMTKTDKPVAKPKLQPKLKPQPAATAVAEAK